MASLPPPADSPQQTPDDSRFARRMARADGCPTACGNYVLPSIVRDQPGELPGFTAHYTCTDCGHDWVTSWADHLDEVEWSL